MSAVRHAQPTHSSTALVTNQLGVGAVTSKAMSAQAPLTVVAGLFIIAIAVTGFDGIPIAVIAVTVALALFQVGFLPAVQKIDRAGTFYACISRGLSRPLGVGAGLSVWLGYAALQVGLYGVFGAVLSESIASWFGTQIPWWVLAFAACGVVSIIGLRSVKEAGTLLLILMGLEFAATLVFSVSNLIGAWPTLTWSSALAPLAVSLLWQPGAGARIAMAYVAVVGQEMPTAYGIEAKPKAVGRAVVLCLVLTGLLYVFATWSLSVLLGPTLVDRARAETTNLFFNVAAERLGPEAVTAGIALLLTSMFAGLVAFHNTSARQAWILGRDGVLPMAMTRTMPRTGAPAVGSVVQSVFGIAAIVLFAVTSWNPLLLFFYGGTSGAVAILTVLAVASLAVPVYYQRLRRTDGSEHASVGVWRAVVAPISAFVLLLAITGMAYGNRDVLLGVEPGSAMTYVLPGTILSLFMIGAVRALRLRSRHPDAYAAIGHGGQVATATGLGRTAVPAQRQRADTQAPEPAKAAR